MTTQTEIRPNRNFGLGLTPSEKENPADVLVDIFEGHSLDEFRNILWLFFAATQDLADEDLSESRSNILMYFRESFRLIEAAWQLARKTGKVPDFRCA